MKPDEALDAAADYILFNGHLKGEYGGEENESPACVLGALAVTLNVSKSDHIRAGTFRTTVEYLRGHLETWSVSRWNDAEETTAEDVMDAMRMTAKGLREDEAQ